VGGGKNHWLSQIRGYVKKLNLAINDIQKQPIEEMEAIKEALEQGFHYLNHPLTFKHVKEQVASVLKVRYGWLRKIEVGER
jgi:superoxide dismutase